MVDRAPSPPTSTSSTVVSRLPTKMCNGVTNVRIVQELADSLSPRGPLNITHESDRDEVEFVARYVKSHRTGRWCKGSDCGVGRVIRRHLWVRKDSASAVKFVPPPMNTHPSKLVSTETDSEFVTPDDWEEDVVEEDDASAVEIVCYSGVGE